ncbi:unnamed protein product [Adineta steineri]|uniref:Phosphatidylinositol-glycan biosynthesis class W protein n=1 Tax=Adineta steineri TaxID=433720 RepID=A0A815GU23_9BILA|nr:unnamed protein product [Adineta steineri]CAF3738841.1 unnamed protein product [Adineta steineri]
MDDYRQRKELFVSNLNGTTLYETASVLINMCTTYFLCQILKPSFVNNLFFNFLFENCIIIIPLISICTLSSSISHIFHFVIWSIALFIYFLKKSSSINNSQAINKSYSRLIELTRGQILIVTCICILAVDFSIFPRRYAKTENYGYSIMDLGVGAFTITHGMVSSEARNKQTNFKELLVENFVLFILGLIRLISVKYFSYIEHISEYGIHWNFFLTLCFMKLIGNSLLLITKNLFALICLTLLFHEIILLRYLQFDNYLIEVNNLRIGFIDANREGIFSLGGYVCLYLIGIFFGRLIINYERNQQFLQMTIKFSIAMIILCGISYNTSRKLCNFGYISSTTGLACLIIASYSIILWLLIRKGYSTESTLLKYVNQKGFDMFLLANVLTGIINLNLNTIDTSNSVALCIIIIYMFVLSTYVYCFPSLIKLMIKTFKLSKT